MTEGQLEVPHPLLVLRVHASLEFPDLEVAQGNSLEIVLCCSGYLDSIRDFNQGK